MKKRNTSKSLRSIRGIPLLVYREALRKADEQDKTIGQYIAEALRNKNKGGN